MTAPASKLLQPITVGPLELKNRIMFPPLTTGYEERDGSIGERSLAFYERLARGGVSYIAWEHRHRRRRSRYDRKPHAQAGNRRSDPHV